MEILLLIMYWLVFEFFWRSSAWAQDLPVDSHHLLHSAFLPGETSVSAGGLMAAQLQSLLFTAQTLVLAGDAEQPSGLEGQLAVPQPSVRQVALAAALAELSGAALAEEVGEQLGMLWPMRLQPALHRALPYLSLCTDR